MKNLKTKLGLVLLTTVAFGSVAHACTSVAWNTKVGTLTSRTNDWVESTSPVLKKINAGTEMSLSGTSDEYTYTSKYDIVAVTAYGLDIVHDGVNSEGMQVNTLYYKPMTMRSTDAEAVTQLSLSAYLISSYKNVEEVVEDINSIQFRMAALPILPQAPTFHWSLTDSSGDRLVIEHDKDGLALYRGEKAMVMTNQPSLQSHIDEWNDVRKSIEAPHGTVNYGAKGNTNPLDRFKFTKYFGGQLKEPVSSIGGLMKLSGTTFKIPHDATNEIAANGTKSTYATEWLLSQNLNTGDAVWQYTWGDTWTLAKFNIKTLFKSSKEFSFNLDDKELSGDVTKQILSTSK